MTGRLLPGSWQTPSNSALFLPCSFLSFMRLSSIIYKTQLLSSANPELNALCPHCSQLNSPISPACGCSPGSPAHRQAYSLLIFALHTTQYSSVFQFSVHAFLSILSVSIHLHLAVTSKFPKTSSLIRDLSTPTSVLWCFSPR